MSNSITERIARPLPERPVQQTKAAENRRADAQAAQQLAARALQDDKAAAARQADKGRHVDRYA